MKKDWIEDNGELYFLDQTGVMKTNWINDGGKWHYINSNGIMNTDLAIPDDNLFTTKFTCIRFVYHRSTKTFTCIQSCLHVDLKRCKQHLYICLRYCVHCW